VLNTYSMVKRSDLRTTGTDTLTSRSSRMSPYYPPIYFRRHQHSVYWQTRPSRYGSTFRWLGRSPFLLCSGDECCNLWHHKICWWVLKKDVGEAVEPDKVDATCVTFIEAVFLTERVVFVSGNGEWHGLSPARRVLAGWIWSREPVEGSESGNWGGFLLVRVSVYGTWW